MQQNDRTWIEPTEAAAIAGVHHATIRLWVIRYGIGVKVASRYRVDPEKLALMLQGALARIDDGADHGRVA